MTFKITFLKMPAIMVFIASLFLLQILAGITVVAAASDGSPKENGANAHAGNPDQLKADPPFHIRGPPINVQGATPTYVILSGGLDVNKIKTVYNLPPSGGSGTIAIIDAFNYPTANTDLNTFSSQFGLPLCNSTNPCFEIHKMASKIRTDGGWALEMALDTQWAHAIAPNAKILLVEAKSNSLTDLFAAVDYARSRSDVVAISMSWIAGEFPSESSYDYHFTSSKATFFAASGDGGTGIGYPAASPNVVAVGGTSLNMSNGSLLPETAWSGSGGGLSAYETEPSYQLTYNVPQANGKRAVPDVSYNADPNSGVYVYDSTPYYGLIGWWIVGGTSAGTPQWAAIKSLGLSASNDKFYPDAQTSYSSHFRDITSGTNGACGFYCNAMAGYDYVTGLGSPITTIY
ncbi:Uncharacterised protein [uncultured archaeon]|nr:Uncharacterised protein [uncultured archaeon]